LVAPGTPGQNTLTVLRLLRNTVHGAALQAIAFEEWMRRQESLVTVPVDDEPEVIAAIAALGGEEAWGLRRIVSHAVHIDPGALVDALFPAVINLLNDLMDRTPLEGLDGVNLTTENSQPPPPNPKNTGMWDEWVRTSIRWQFGF